MSKNDFSNWKSKPMNNNKSKIQKQFLKGKLKTSYLVDYDNYQQFNSYMTIFSRVSWDKSSKIYGKYIYDRMPDQINRGKPGYSRLEYAAQKASWTITNCFPGATSWERLQQHGRGEILDELPKYEINDLAKDTDRVKKVAKFYGASLVGITELNRHWIYTHNREDAPIIIPANIKYAIVFAIEMDENAIATSPAIPAAMATGNGYSRMAFIQACMAEFIRNLGYQAIPCGNDTALSVPLAIDAGLGQYSRMGLLITPKYGPRVRLAKVLTDLPLIPDQPDLKFNQSVIRFCKTCKKCAKFCPSKSISNDSEPSWEGLSKSNNPGIFKWYVDGESCYNFWNKNGAGCSVCIRVCPYTKSQHWSHNVARWFIKNLPQLNRFWIWSDDLLGYGKRKIPDKFWESENYIHLRH